MNINHFLPLLHHVQESEIVFSFSLVQKVDRHWLQYLLQCPPDGHQHQTPKIVNSKQCIIAIVWHSTVSVHGLNGINIILNVRYFQYQKLVKYGENLRCSITAL
jgi:hypothetical protein